MSDTIYRIEDVRLRVLAHLRTGGPKSAEQLAEATGVPPYAITPALDSAHVAGLAALTADGMWFIPTPPPRAT